MLRVVVLVSGGGTNLQAILDAIRDGRIHDTEVVRVISNNAHAYALERAKAAGVEAQVLSPKNFETRDDFNKAFLQTLEEIDPDLIVLAGFLVIVPPEILNCFQYRVINIHPSLIPSFCGTGYYGLKVHEAVLARDVKVTGATCHFVVAGETDGGPIILQQPVFVKPGDTPEILQKRVMKEAEWKILPKAIDLIARGKVSVVDGHAIVEE